MIAVVRPSNIMIVTKTSMKKKTERLRVRVERNLTKNSTRKGQIYYWRFLKNFIRPILCKIVNDFKQRKLRHSMGNVSRPSLRFLCRLLFCLGQISTSLSKGDHCVIAPTAYGVSRLAVCSFVSSCVRPFATKCTPQPLKTFRRTLVDVKSQPLKIFIHRHVNKVRSPANFHTNHNYTANKQLDLDDPNFA